MCHSAFFRRPVVQGAEAKYGIVFKTFFSLISLILKKKTKQKQTNKQTNKQKNKIKKRETKKKKKKQIKNTINLNFHD